MREDRFKLKVNNDFLGEKRHEEKINKLNFIKIFIFFSIIYHYNKKNQGISLGKIYMIHISEKGIVSGIYKELLQLNNWIKDT